MRLTLPLFITCFLTFSSRAQLLVAPDTLRAHERVLGTTDSLLQFMEGFSSPFFISPEQAAPDLWSLFKPGMAPLSRTELSQRKLVFTALPHLGFAYGFGAQGSQRLRLDYEQQFAHHTLLNLRYDRHQQTGFLRSSDLRYSALDLQLVHFAKRYQASASFSNVNHDRQWSGGLASWSQVGIFSSELLPVVKSNAYTFQNGYRAKIEAAYFLNSDSISGLRLLTKHSYHNQVRRYEETDSLELFYNQLNLSSDSCRDVFATQIWDHQVGLAYVQNKLFLSSALALRRLSWQDTQLGYDTTELNVVNTLQYQFNNSYLNHNSSINLYGAGNGIHTDTRLKTELPFGFLQVQHLFLRGWPELQQRTYLSNLTSYQVYQPQLQQSMLIAAKLAMQWGPLKSICSISYMRNKQVYRFNSQDMIWQLSGPQRAFQLGLDLAYERKSWEISSRTKYVGWQLADQHILPPLTSDLRLQWKGGVFKNKQLKLLAGATVQAMYGGSFHRMAYLPYLETIDWQQYQSGSQDTIQQILNAKIDLILEVKTFRFFMQASNLFGFVDPTASLYRGIPYPTTQIRLGLTWDFWN
jgi:hypothetical protein